MPEKQKVAAIDLGSNSFHMVVADMDEHGIEPLDSLKEMVRLAAGLDKENYLSEQKIQEAVDCLRIFGQRIKDFPAKNVQCVGTNTLRKAENATEFLQQAEEALGFPISIIGGYEEARLVYQGVAHSIAQTEEHRLVIDIGGGSTEFIIGQNNKPILMESLNMGCVNFTQKYFETGKITKSAVKNAILASRQKLEWISDDYIEHGWQEAIGSSGTIKTIAAILDQNYNRQGIIEYKYLKELSLQLIDFKYTADIQLAGLSNKRAPVIIGGLCVLMGAFEELGITQMSASNGALREGLLYDMLDISTGRDIRMITVKKMMDRYQVDIPQTQRILKIALSLCEQMYPMDDGELKNLLTWAIQLHEIGLSISHINSAGHSAYIVEQSDMPGFSRQDQNMLGLLLRMHRGKIKKKQFEDMPRKHKRSPFLLTILRLSVMLARGRDQVSLEKLTAIKNAKQIDLVFQENYLENHPLTVADLEQEKKEIAKLGYELNFRDFGGAVV